MPLIQNFVQTIQHIGKIPELRRKLLVTLGLLVIYRIGFAVPIPGVNTRAIAQLTKQFAEGDWGQVFQLANLVSGGGVLTFTMFALGIMPYISASIIFQLLTKVVPTLEQLSKEGESGRRKINQWTRYSTIGISVVQSFFMMTTVSTQFSQIVAPGVGTAGFVFMGVVSLTTGTCFLMWLGEKITDHGIGNGASIIIMAGIIAGIPGAVFDAVSQFNQGSVKWWGLLLLLVSFVATVAGVVYITQGQRRIPIQQAKHTRGRRQYGGQRHYMPLKVNMAGVMPIIFASALLTFPQIIINLVAGEGSSLAGMFSEQGSFLYVFLYVVMVFVFSFFWNQLIFNPVEMANNMKEWGSFVPGIRPGKKTAVFLEGSMNRITLAGALFLSIIAVFPIVLLDLTNITLIIFLGGTSILIVVGVALDVVQKIESHLLMRHYKGFLGGGGIRGRK
jgi:preprotein translocase subunit SecY